MQPFVGREASDLRSMGLAVLGVGRVWAQAACRTLECSACSTRNDMQRACFACVVLHHSTFRTPLRPDRWGGG